MGQSSGRIELDLVLNKRQYDRQLKGITAMAKKAGAALAAAFTVKKMADFGKQCLELGSDLAEVQNVVDVTFPHMTAQVDKFAQSAAASFGLSETMAKKFTGTFGAMAKAFGFSESEAYNMGVALTGLAGDVASFYNITQDEAYTKLKSVFTGETESLKDLGVVMTQSALDAYALANGYGKTTSAMSEAEKVALRYAFVQNQLSAAAGDFTRTSDSWANQVRVLSLQFDSLKATIGQGLINVFLPVIKVINTVIGKLAALANAFKAFTELVTGKKSAGSQMASAGALVQENLGSAAGEADNLAGAAAGAGKAAKKAAKEMKALMGFDQVNKLDNTSESDSGSSGSGGTSGGNINFGNLAQGETVLDKADVSCSKLIEHLKELAGLCKNGFSIGFGDSEKRIRKIAQSCESIKQSLTEIFTSKKIVNAANTWANSIAFNIGKLTGSIAGVGIAIATNLISGVERSLEEKKGFIQEKIASLLTINADSWTLIGNFSVAFGDIVSRALTSDAAVNISSDIFSILTTGVFGGAELFTKAGLDITSFLVQPIIDNKEKIENAITNTLEPVSDVVGTIKTAVDDAFSIIGKAYDNHIAPMFGMLKQGFSDTFGKFLEVYNTYVAPVLQNLSGKFSEVYKKHIKPCMEKIGGTLGYIADVVSEVYTTWFKPFIDWLIETMLPIVAPIFETFGRRALDVFGSIADAVSALLDVFRGITEFLRGVFAGDWDRALEGLKTIFQGFVDFISVLCEGIKTFFGTIWEAIKEIFEPVADWFKEKFEAAREMIYAAFAAIGTWFKDRYDDITKAFDGIKNWFKSKFDSARDVIHAAFAAMGTWFKDRYNDITRAFGNISAWFKSKFDSARDVIHAAFAAIGTWFSGRYNDICNAMNGIGGWFSGKFQEAWRGVTGAFSGVTSFFKGIYDKITSLFKDIGTSIGGAVSGAFKSSMNSAFSTVENAINGFIKGINGAIGIINKIPGVNIKKINPVNIPRLAQGGYVKPNTPQLAMIGDNRHQGEVVAPEDKLKEMAMEAVRMAGGSNNYSMEILKVLLQILEVLKTLDLNIVIDGKKLKDIIVEKINQHTRATGVCEIIC